MIVWLSKTVVSTLVLANLLLAPAGSASAQRRLTLAEARALARGSRAEIASAELDVKLARLELIRAGLDRVRLRLDGRWGEQVERLYLNAPAGLCASVDQLCRPAQRARVVDLAANLEIPIWSGFALEAGWSRARARERAARAGKGARLQALDLEVANAYWSVRLAELLRDAAGRALERRREVAALIRSRAQAGLAPRTDRDRAEIAALRQQALVAELGGQAEQARSELGAVLQVEGPLELVDDPETRAPVLPPLPGLLAAADDRPELALVRAELVVRAEEARIARGGWWPHLDLFARAEARNEAFGVAQPALIGHFVAGLQLRWLAFDGLNTWQAVRAADLERQRALVGHDRARQVVAAEVRGAHVRLSSALARRAPLSSALALARDTLEAVRRRYQTGAAILIEVLDAEAELADLEAAASTSAIDVALAEAALQAASGSDPAEVR